jgi:hypothetical protein
LWQGIRESADEGMRELVRLREVRSTGRFGRASMATGHFNVFSADGKLSFEREFACFRYKEVRLGGNII